MASWRDYVPPDVMHPDGPEWEVEEPPADTESYRCPECGEVWGVQGWFPPDYHFSDWTGHFADVFCVDYGEDVFCEHCPDVQGERL